jgi:hypothetical protein
MARKRYSEHEKLPQISEKSNICGAFLDWLQNDRKLVIADWGDEDDERLLYPAHIGIERLLAEYFKIDFGQTRNRKAGDARRIALRERKERELRSANEKKGTTP